MCMRALWWIHWVPVKSSRNKAQNCSKPGSFGAQDQDVGMSDSTQFISSIMVNTYKPGLHCSKQTAHRKYLNHHK